MSLRMEDKIICIFLLKLKKKKLKKKTKNFGFLQNKLILVEKIYLKLFK